MVYNCCSEERRSLVKEHPWLNGIDYIEVIDKLSDPVPERQTTLLAYFIKTINQGSLSKDNILIEGGVRITNIQVTDVCSYPPDSPPGSPLMSPPNFSPAKTLCIKVDSPGDFSTYTLRLVKDSSHKLPPDGFDPILSSIDFSFKVSCPNPFDCQSKTVCKTKPDQIPNINYLAKDYTSIRRIMLDRLSLLLPDWQERNAADLGVTLVELLAYVGDYLSYQQDAITTEAYLGTARKRISVRRHARLVDYFVHDGSNARVWIQLVVNKNIQSISVLAGKGKTKTKFLTKVKDSSKKIINYSSYNFDDALFENVQIFELMHDCLLYSKHNEMQFYTWGNKECCLPKGSTHASLSGDFRNLKVGDVLILSEVKDPKTGLMKEDADPSHRHVVRLIEINYTHDPIGSIVISPLSGSPPDNRGIPVTEIAWHEEDALPFPLCISSQNENIYHENVSVAWGNIVLADHGTTYEDEGNTHSLIPSTVPRANALLFPKADSQTNRCKKNETISNPPRYRPILKKGPITQAAAYTDKEPRPSAQATMKWSMNTIKPAITLIQDDDQTEWNPKRDLLLNCDHNSRNFVVEIETDGVAHLRFGDNKHGARPVSGTKFRACYRIGNGINGNIGADKLARIVSNDPTIYSNTECLKVWNPLPAIGGTEPESIEEARQKAGYAFREQERAVTSSDYEELAEKIDTRIQSAAASFRWTGSWYTAFLTFDLLSGKKVDKTFEESMIKSLNRYRMAGQDLEIDNPQFISLEIEMVVCLQKNYYASDVKAAILSVFTNHLMPNGNPGLFHPDNFTFGQILYLSKYYATAQAIPGIRTVKITKFQRQGYDSDAAIKSGKITLSRLEIARLDNDPNHNENGVFNVIVNESVKY